MIRLTGSHRTFIAALVAAVAACVSCTRAPETVSSAALLSMSPALNESEIRDRDIEFYSRRISEDKSSALDKSALASLLFTRSRYTGSVTDLDRAEKLARESLALRTQRNTQSFQLLASILMARHEFGEARSIAQKADSLNPDVPSNIVLLGETELELGDYSAAASNFERVNYSGQQFTIAARLARWHELTGRVDIARKLLKQAIAKVDLRDDLPREQIAWFHYRLGELELRSSNMDAADRAFHVGLEKNPDDVRILGGLARLALTRRDWKAAVAFGEKATEVQLDPATLGTVSLAYGALGDTAQAASYARAMSVSALKQPGVIHRAWGLFLLDHGTAADRANVLNRARLELKVRKDVYGHDLMAWALFRNGRLSDAKKEMRLALSQHTQDRMLLEHAFAIGLVAE
jgi:tetratricopeptide (TPR) repeat protein